MEKIAVVPKLTEGPERREADTRQSLSAGAGTKHLEHLEPSADRLWGDSGDMVGQTLAARVEINDESIGDRLRIKWERAKWSVSDAGAANGDARGYKS